LPTVAITESTALRVSAWPRPVSLVTACTSYDSFVTALLKRFQRPITPPPVGRRVSVCGTLSSPLAPGEALVTNGSGPRRCRAIERVPITPAAA
jgi:hypothetical protein